MTDHFREEPPPHHRVTTMLSLIGIVILSLWTLSSLGALDWQSVVNVPGGTRQLVSTYATVDHPFHATRAQLLLDSLQRGDILRWIPSHEGGYPVELYPLGIPWLDVAVWAGLLGQVPIVALHKTTVAIIFILPVVGFWILARGDRSSPFVPLFALAIQVSVPGDWMHGGRMELVYWGLVANVGGATLAFIMLAAFNRWVREGSRFYGVVAVACTVAALYTNTRSAIAIVIATCAVVLAAVLATSRNPEDRWPALRLIAGRTTFVALLSALLVAPLLLPAIQYAHLYYFVNFESYADFDEIVWASKTAITPVFAVLALGGCVLALIRHVTQQITAVAMAFVLYVTGTICIALVPWLASTIQQLEAPRLMPFQRFVSIYLAAWFVGKVIQACFSRVRSSWLRPIPGSILLGSTIVVLLVFQGKFGELPLPYRQPVPWTTGYPEYGNYEDAVREVSLAASDGTAIFIVGDQMGWWHEQLWAPSFSDRMFFYDDWMWYWHSDHEGPYDPGVGHAYQDPSLAFNRDWFDAHGVGAVLVTDMPVSGGLSPRVTARTNPLLQYQRTIGEWDLYLVADPVTMVTNGDLNASSVVTDGGLIEATFEGGAAGEIEIRRNWFPRWEAWADGQPVEIERTDNGYMRVTVPEGTITLELRYGVTPVDWLGRILAVAGVVGLVTLAVNRPRRLWTILSISVPDGAKQPVPERSSPVTPSPLEDARSRFVRTLVHHTHDQDRAERQRTSARTRLVQALAFRSHDLDSPD